MYVMLRCVLTHVQVPTKTASKMKLKIVQGRELEATYDEGSNRSVVRQTDRQLSQKTKNSWISSVKKELLKHSGHRAGGKKTEGRSQHRSERQVWSAQRDQEITFSHVSTTRNVESSERYSTKVVSTRLNWTSSRSQSISPRQARAAETKKKSKTRDGLNGRPDLAEANGPSCLVPGCGPEAAFCIDGTPAPSWLRPQTPGQTERNRWR